MTGRLALFANDKRAHDKAPDAKGVGEIDGVKVEAAAWWRTSKAGQQYLSVTIAPPRERQPEKGDWAPGRPLPPAPAPAAPTPTEPEKDDIPF